MDVHEHSQPPSPFQHVSGYIKKPSFYIIFAPSSGEVFFNVVTNKSRVSDLLQKIRMPLNLGDTFPNLDVETSEGKFKLHDYFGDKYVQSK